MKKRILITTSNLRNGNGVASCMMNYYDGLIAAGYHVDFLVQAEVPSQYAEYVKKHGGVIYALPKSTGKPQFCNMIFVSNLLKSNQYSLLHNNLNGFYGVWAMKMAKQYGCKLLLHHAHNPKDTTTKKASFRAALYNPLCVKISNYHIACSSLAGDSIFGEGNYQIVRNAIRVDRFVFNAESRKRIKEELECDNRFIIGCVCRQTEQKNPFFTLDILKAYLKYDESSILIWAGTGELLDSVKSYAEQIGVSDHVIFLGDRADVNKLYSAMDVFLLPSRFEGLGMVYVEAQCSGLYCFASSTVPRDTAITPNIQYINLSKSAEEWAQKIAQSKEYYFQRGDYSKIISDNGYNLRKEKGRMAEIYDMALANRR